MAVQLPQVSRPRDANDRRRRNSVLVRAPHLELRADREALPFLFMLLEGTDAKIHLIYYTPDLEEARSRGQLGANAFH